MEDFELQGKADFFGRINRISKAMKEERKRKQIFEGKNHKEIIAKKEEKETRKEEN
jgi:hypothetical protein